MPKFFVKQDQIKDKNICIIGSDVNHIKNVLREKIGNNINICNVDDSTDYICEITSIDDERIECNIIEEIKSEVESDIKVTIFQGLPKSDKMELIITKSVELGAFDITPVEMKRCVVKLTDKDKVKKISRWQKISEVAAKQCGRGIIPEVNNVLKITDISKHVNDYDVILLAYECENENSLKNEIDSLKSLNKKELKIGIIIGPEGGVDIEEVNKLQEAGIKSITLGKRILRTETVALNILSIIMYELEQ